MSARLLSHIFLTIILSSSVQSQKKSKGQNPNKGFNEKFETALWLAQYDQVAWTSSDSVSVQDPKEIALLGNEWFCFVQAGVWHAVYGKYENDLYDIVFHFRMDEHGNALKSFDPVDTMSMNRYARALHTANAEVLEMRKKYNLDFNQYIRENEDRTLTVWILPAFQQEGVAIYGGEFIYTLDPEGIKILNNESYFQGNFRGFQVNEDLKEIRLNYSELEQPTLGAIFFAWYYRNYFNRIIIQNSQSSCTLVPMADQWTWVHFPNTPDKRGKKARKK